MYVDLKFRVTTEDLIPVDHGYRLYAALSNLVPDLHQNNEIGIHSLRGKYLLNHHLELRTGSCLVLRTPVEQIYQFLSLTGKTIQMNQAKIRIGVPQVTALFAAPTLWSRLVIIKVAGQNAAQLDALSFRASIEKQLSGYDVNPEGKVDIRKRRTLKIKNKVIVGYEVLLENLTQEESLQVQIMGVGGRRHMGCGLFTAYRPRNKKMVTDMDETIGQGGYGIGK
jgi:CRISPR-associated protein Cas6